jgi:ribosomal protein S18 acetylase RimI-like enzyme
MKFVHHVSARHFLETAEGWLLRNEAEHNLLLGLAHARAQDVPPDEPPAFFATIQEGDRVRGCLFRTPPYKLGLTRMPEVALPLAVQGVATVYDTLPGVIGPPETIRAFADVWAGRMEVEVIPGMEMGIHALEEVTPPAHPAPGRMRLAAEDDEPLLAEWGRRFVEDTGVALPDPEGRTRALLQERALHTWDDGGRVVSMAAALAPTPRGIRIGYVYTPPEHRRRGYASTLVARLSQLLLDGGRSFCFLYTDLSNPTSNRIYHEIGYRRVAEAGELNFVESPRP